MLMVPLTSDPSSVTFLSAVMLPTGCDQILTTSVPALAWSLTVKKGEKLINNNNSSSQVPKQAGRQAGWLSVVRVTTRVLWLIRGLQSVCEVLALKVKFALDANAW